MICFCLCQQIDLNAIQGCDVIRFVKVVMVYGVCNASLCGHASTFHCVCVLVLVCGVYVCDWVIECVCTIHCSGLSDSL